MIRLALSIMILLHGLLHALGFISAFGWAEIPQMKQEISKFNGVVWLAAALFLIFTSVIYLLKKEWWWMAAIPAAILSQILITMVWQDAKFGTLPNIIILIISVISYGDWSFNKSVDKSVQALVPTTLYQDQQVIPEKLSGLPPLVQTWMQRSEIMGTNIPQRAHLWQKGQMKTKPANDWMQVEAEQWMILDPPGFAWKARVGQGSLLQFSGRDVYREGRGQMIINLYSLFPVVHAVGEPIDQGALVRYLAEIIWFPWAVLNSNIQWETLDGSSVKATLIDGGLTVSGIFRFSKLGDVIGFEALRYYYDKPKSSLEKWVVQLDENSFREFEGIRIPCRSTVTWVLSTGEFTWYRVTITDAHFY